MHRAKIALLVLGDVLALYLSLFTVLFLRYRGDFPAQLADHLIPFSVIFLAWVIVFYIAGLYDLRRLRNNLEFLKMFALTLSVSALIAVTFFYLSPVSKIAPKTNLFLFLIVFAVLGLSWRRLFNRFIVSLEPSARVLLAGQSPAAQELFEFLAAHPQLGYAVALWLRGKEDSLGDAAALQRLVREYRADLIVVPREIKKESRLAKGLYQLLAQGVEVYDVPTFSEMTLRKVPIEEVSEEWFLEHITGQHRFYDNLKRAAEVVAALLLAVILLPLEIAIAVLVKLSSPGPVFYKQVRIGKNGKEFTLYKFRDMRVDAEKNGAQWKTSGTRDPRLTWIGRILVPTHLDELAQLINILRGDMSFVGPRPERPEFVRVLENKIPFYKIRHLVNPGVAGWAQINYRYGASVEDAAEKLRYDVYYIKNRSVILDIAIVLKTVKSFFVNQK